MIKKLKITYKEVHPGMQQLGGGVWGSVFTKNMPLKELLLKTWNQAMQFVKTL